MAAPAAGTLAPDLSGASLPLAAEEIFGRACQMEVEIGVGKGRFLLEWAAARPDLGLLGVERARVYAGMAARRAARRGLTNVRIIHTSAEDMLFRCLRPGSVAAVHVYFADPWPKRRHHKRRFFRPDNVSRLADVLAVGGLLRVKTDHRGYAELIAELVAREPRLAPVPLAEGFAGIPTSGFEVKYAREQRAVHRFAWRRREDAP